MAVGFKYGSGEVSLDLTENAVALSHTEPPLAADPDTFKRVLYSSVKKLKNNRIRNAGIVVSDKTRVCEYPAYLPLVTEVLAGDGLDPGDITFYIAYGTHAVQTDEESLFCYGETFNKYRFVHHHSKDDTNLVRLGTTARGTEVMINKKIREHDLLITFGAVLHHYFAGFGGGRKLLFPGMAGYHSILQNHQLFLDFEQMKIREGCRSGNLETNPLALDLEEINTFLPERLEIHAILDSKKKVREVYMGTGYGYFKKTCERYDRFFRCKEDKQFDLVVASAGGFPKDINFIQAHKSLHNAASFVKDRGKLIIIAECREGIGNPSFMNLFKPGVRDTLFDKMKIQYANNAGTAFAMLDKSTRIEIHFVTSLDEETCHLMGAFKTSLTQARQVINNEKGEVAWIENAGLLYK